MIRLLNTLILLVFLSSHLLAQTEIRGPIDISTHDFISDSVNTSPNREFERRIKLSPIDKSSFDFEIRFYTIDFLYQKRNLKILTLNGDKWKAWEYEEFNKHDEWDKPKKIKRHKLYVENDFESFIHKLHEQNFTRLPNQNELADRMKKVILLDGEEAEQVFAIFDGYGYTLEFEFDGKFRIIKFDNPEEHAAFYRDVIELKNYASIKKLFETELLRK